MASIQIILNTTNLLKEKKKLIVINLATKLKQKKFLKLKSFY